MKQQCDYCSSYIDDTEETCPNCGAPNARYTRKAVETPATIEQLQQWYRDHNLPDPEVTRFFIGVDYKQPKAFGIYRSGDRVIVYKNKADGKRAIHYDGGDEAYAVNEIYLKLKETIADQKARNTSLSGSARKPKQKMSLLKKAAVTLLVLFSLSFCTYFLTKPSQGYYQYNGQQYYYLDDWYVFGPGGWQLTTVDSTLADSADDYYESSSYSSGYGTTDFSETEFYSHWAESSHSDWDSDSNWDSGDSWDSDFGDWDSDW